MTPAGSPGSTGLSVLVVCTANQCRSPLAEFALRRAAAGAGLGWTVSSAGTRAVSGRGPDRQVSRILTDQGVDLTGWRSRRVDAESIEQSDLILVMSEHHRADIGMLVPSALPRTWLLLEYAARARGSDLDSGTSDSFEVADPVGRSRRAFLRCARQLESAAADIVSGRPPRR